MRGEEVEYECDADALGGRVHLDGKLGEPEPKPQSLRGTLRLERVQLGRLWGRRVRPGFRRLAGFFGT